MQAENTSSRSLMCVFMWFYVDVYNKAFFRMHTNPLQRVDSGVILSSLQVFGKETVGDRGEFLIAGIPLALVSCISHLRDTQPLLL